MGPAIPGIETGKSKIRDPAVIAAKITVVIEKQFDSCRPHYRHRQDSSCKPRGCGGGLGSRRRVWGVEDRKKRIVCCHSV